MKEMKFSFCNACVKPEITPNRNVFVSKGIYQLLEEKIAHQVDLGGDRVCRSKACLKLIKIALEQLKAHCAVHEFVSELEQQKFHRELWPKFTGLQFYFKELIWMEYNKPIGDNYELIAFYTREIEFIRHFFARHAGQYQLHKLKMMELEEDELPPDHLIKWAESSEHAEEFSEQCTINARFIGYEMLLKEALSRLQEHQLLEETAPRNVMGSRLKWTGKLTNLVELAYGLYETGQFNNGQVLISDIFRWLEQSFQVDLKFAYTIYDDIKSRKRMSPAHFLEQMRIALLCRIESDLGYVPGSY